MQDFDDILPSSAKVPTQLGWVSFSITLHNKFLDPQPERWIWVIAKLSLNFNLNLAKVSFNLHFEVIRCDSQTRESRLSRVKFNP